MATGFTQIRASDARYGTIVTARMALSTPFPKGFVAPVQACF
jgi:hypothetical protein